MRFIRGLCHVFMACALGLVLPISVAAQYSEPSGHPNLLRDNRLRQSSWQDQQPAEARSGGVGSFDSAPREVIVRGANGDVPSAETQAGVDAETPVPPAGDSAGDSAAILSLDELRQRIKSLQEAAGIDEPLKEEAIKKYQSAVELMGAVEKAVAQAAECRAQVESAPQRIHETRQRLAQPPAKVELQYPPQATLAELDQFRSQAEAALNEARSVLSRREAEAKARAERKQRLPQAEADAKQRLEDTRSELAAGTQSSEAPLVAEARNVELHARQLLCEAELDLLSAQSRRRDAIVELVPLEDDLAARDARHAEKVFAAWEELVMQRRAEESARQVREARRQAASAHPALKEIAERNAELAERLPKLASLIAEKNARKKTLDDLHETMRVDFEGINQQVELAGLTSTIGLHLRDRKEQLPDLAELRKELREIAAEVARVQVEKLHIKRERDELTDLEESVQRALAGLANSPSKSTLDLEQTTRELLENKQKYVSNLLNDYDTYLQDLGELELSTRKVIAQSEQYLDYIHEHVLWIRSDKFLAVGDFRDAAKNLMTFASPTNWRAAASALVVSVRNKPAETMMLLASFALLLLLRSRFKARLVQLGRRASENDGLRFLVTLEALGHTLLIASLSPFLIWLLGWRLGEVDHGSEFTLALAAGLKRTASILWIVEVLRQVAQASGLGHAHFGWNVNRLAALRRHLKWVWAFGIPLTFVAATLHAFHGSVETTALGRLVFMTGMGLLAWLLIRMLRPGSGILADSPDPSSPAAAGTQHAWPWLAAAVPMSFLLLALVGYYYTAQQLAARLESTAWLVLALVFCYGLVIRGLAIARRQLAVAKAAMRSARTRPTSVAGGEMQLPVAAADLAEVDFSRASAQTLQLVRGLLAACFLVGVAVVWMDVLPAFNVLNRVELWSRVEQVNETVSSADGADTVLVRDQRVPTTLQHLCLALLIVAVTVLAGKNLPGVLEVTLLQRIPLDQGGRNAVATIFRYLLTLVGMVFAFRVLGIGWSSVQWLAAAMTVGLGFGLQEIFANFVSGLIILFERPIRVGDLVTVSDITGTVSRTRIRATTIVDFDRRELIVPNKKFITDNVINWTLTDPISRVVIPIGVAYGSDTGLAHSLLLQAATEHSLVLNDPQPTAIFKGFGQSSLDFDLRFFIPKRDVYGVVVHEVNTAIDQAFRKAGIEIAFPQRDLHIRSVQQILPFEVTSPDERSEAA